MITPFYLSASLIVRQRAEVHDEVACLLRKLRRLLDSREHPGGVEAYDREWEALGLPAPSTDSKSAPAAHNPPPDRNTRIRHLLDELRLEIEKLPKGKD